MMVGMNHDEAIRSRRIIAWLIVTGFLFVLIAYPLSIGPAAVAVSWGYIPLATYNVAYQPVATACWELGISHWLEMYVAMWF
jgi:hypothetical protein